MSLRRGGWHAPVLLSICLGVASLSGCASGAKMKLKAVDKGIVKSVAFSPDGKLLASGASGTGIKLWDVGTGEVKRTLEGHSYGTESVAFSPDGRMLVSGGEDVKLWDVESGRLIRRMDEERKLSGSLGIRGVAFSRDGKSFASAGQQLIIWDTETGEAIKRFDHGFYVVALSPDGKSIASVGSNTIRLFDIESGKLRLELKQPDKYADIEALAYSPDGKLLASAIAGTNSSVKVWDAETGELKQTLTPYDITTGFGIQAVAFSSDGRFLASGNGNANTITIWDTKTWELKLKLKNSGLIQGFTGKGSIEAVAFSPDGKLLASGDWDAMVKLWDISDLK